MRELEEALAQENNDGESLRLKRRNLQDFLKGRCLFHRKQRRKKIVKQCSEIIRRPQKA